MRCSGVVVLAFSVSWMFACQRDPPGEWDPVQCRDGKDNDGDRLADCLDPDCWAFACGAEPAPPSPAPAAGSGGAPLPFDAGTPAQPQVDASLPPTFPDLDSGVEEDAGPMTSPPPAACSPSGSSCATGQTCVNGSCKPIDITGNYVLEIVSAVLPSRMASGGCYDPDVWCAIGACDGTCLPDPYVVVTKNSVVRVGTTGTLPDTVRPKWSSARFELALTDSDKLVFAVWDNGLINSSVFSCSPDLLLQLPSGMLSCSPPSRAAADAGPSTTYEVVARISKRAP